MFSLDIRQLYLGREADLKRTDKTSFLRKDLNFAFGLFGASD
jgi:hypothetical protein